MRKYKYRAMSGNGKIVSGELDAADYKDACNKLRAMSLVPVSAERADSAHPNLRKARNPTLQK